MKVFFWLERWFVEEKNLGKYLKTLLKAVFYYSGIYRMLIYFHRDRIPVLMIHGVLDEEMAQHWEPSWRRTSSKQLESVISVLSRYFDFESMGEIADTLAHDSVPKRAKLGLTFDDGYRNNITCAAPILIRKDSPAVFYLSTGNIVSRAPMWIDRLDFVLQKLKLPEIEIKLQEQVFKITLTPRSRFEEDYLYFRRSIKNLYSDDCVMLSDIAAEASRLEHLAGASLLDSITDDPVAEMMTADEAKGKYDKITFGSHTVTHVRLDRVPDELLLSELRESKSWIEGIAREQCPHFCYPNGDFNRRSIAAVAECGYKTAVTTIAGSNRVGDSELLALRRISIPQNEKTYEILHSVAISLLRSERVRAIN